MYKIHEVTTEYKLDDVQSKLYLIYNVQGTIYNIQCTIYNKSRSKERGIEFEYAFDCDVFEPLRNYLDFV